MARPSMADTPAEVEAILRTLPDRLKPGVAESLSATYHWDVVGAEQPHWTVRIGEVENGCEVSPGHEGEAACTVRMSVKTFLAVETGKRSPVVAFVKGRIKVSNVGQMRRFDRAFYKFYDVPKEAADAS